MKARITNLSALHDALSFSDVAKGTMEILECALIGAQNNMLTVTFSDLCIWLGVEVPAEVEEGGEVAVKARLLEGFVRSVKEPVVIKTHRDRVVVSSGEAELKLAPYDAEDFPRDIEAETICTVTVRADVLKQALKKLLFIPSKDELQPVRSSVYLHVVDGELRVVATDGVRLGIVPVMKGCSVERAEGLFPKYTMQILQKLISTVSPDDVTIAFKTSMAVFSVGPFSLSSPVLEYAYPDYQRVFPEKIVGEVRTNRKQLVGALCLSAMVSKIVKLSHDCDFLVLVSEGDNTIATDRIKCEIHGEIPKIAFNTRFLLGPLTAIDDEEVVMRFSGPLSPAVLESRDYVYVLMPMRLIPEERRNNGRNL